MFSPGSGVFGGGRLVSDSRSAHAYTLDPKNWRKPMRRLTKASIAVFAALAALAVLLLASSASVGSALQTASTKRVSVKDNFFSPRKLTVRRGSKVTWVWRGALGHTVTFRKLPSGAGRIKGTGVLHKGARFSHTFRTHGTYRYVCRIHAGMSGSVVVK
jgi:plastocyanin